MADIDVRPAGGGRFTVHVTEGGSETSHDVTISPDDLTRLGSGYATPEEFLRACFEFLLEREPKESILRSFEIREISGYFPEFEREISR